MLQKCVALEIMDTIEFGAGVWAQVVARCALVIAKKAVHLGSVAP